MNSFLNDLWGHIAMSATEQTKNIHVHVHEEKCVTYTQEEGFLSENSQANPRSDNLI